MKWEPKNTTHLEEEFIEPKTTKVVYRPTGADALYYTTEPMGACIAVERSAPSEDYLTIDIDDMWMCAGDLREAAALFLRLASSLDGAEHVTGDPE